jgi:hypothetical protein
VWHELQSPVLRAPHRAVPAIHDHFGADRERRATFFVVAKEKLPAGLGGNSKTSARASVMIMRTSGGVVGSTTVPDDAKTVHGQTSLATRLPRDVTRQFCQDIPHTNSNGL